MGWDGWRASEVKASLVYCICGIMLELFFVSLDFRMHLEVDLRFCIHRQASANEFCYEFFFVCYFRARDGGKLP